MKPYLFLSTALSIVICFTSEAQDLARTLTVSAGTSVSIASGTTLNAPNINLKSTSNKYACLLLNGALGTATIVNYDRYVNVVGVAGANGGNDLISLPVKKIEDVTFGEFLNYSPNSGLTPNSDIIVNSTVTPTLYAFGPYDNSRQSYINYDATQDGDIILERGHGYRSATYSGQTVRFTGTVSSNSETVTITTNGRNYWNLIGNPYPTYINSQVFLAQNSAVLDPNATAIYGYNSGNAPSSGTIGNFTIINNLTNANVNIAPGQGFLVANNRNTPTNQISFTMAMRTLTGTDDFILGRNANPNQMIRLRAEHASANFATEIYFNEQSTSGLDPGYDAEIFSGTSSNLMLYSQLAQHNLGRNMAIQSLGFIDLNEVIIPLGLKTSKGSKVTLSIESSTLTPGTDVYLDDSFTNTITLLSTSNYTFTASTPISGTGRFFLRFGNSTLSTTALDSNSIKLYASEQTIFINGLLLADTQVSIYDIQGRLIFSSFLEEGSETNRIEANSLNSGIYVVQLKNEKQTHTKKVLLK